MKLCSLSLCLSFLLCSLYSPVGAITVQDFDAVVDRYAGMLEWESSDGNVFFRAGGEVELVAFGADADTGAPGFFFMEPAKDMQFSPRLALKADLFVGNRFLAAVTFRYDDGVHPGLAEFYTENTKARWDIYFARYALIPGSLEIQAGRYTPFIGTFMERVHGWDSALISYPVAYEMVTSISDAFAPGSRQGFVNRANLPGFGKALVWVPIFWAPLYTQNASLFGTYRGVEYAFNVQNSAPSSRGFAWEDDFSVPTFSGRIGHRPNAAWRYGVSFSHGPYLRDGAQPSLPPGADYEDFAQSVVGIDLAWEGGPWQVWSEFWWSNFEVPRVPEDPKIWSYFIEAKRKLGAQWWLAARWNHEFYNKISTPSGEQKWDNELHRADVGFGFKPSRHLLLKAQYSWLHHDADFQDAEHFWATQLVFKF